MIGLALLLAAAPAFVERACADAALAGKARCGTVAVPEDRDRPDGRVIRLNVVVLPASGGPAKSSPLFDLEGGPGLAVTKNVGFYLTDGAIYRKGRDIVLVDQRGTGGSHPLQCPELVAPETAYQPLYPPDAVDRCRRELEKDADLTRYGTMDAVADLDAVRSALGHDRIDLQGLSYGTTVALRYLATYPDRVRAMVLFGTVPTSATPPGNHAQAAERALKLLDAECAADTACHAAFDPENDLAVALRRLPGIEGAPPAEIFTEKIRSLMYGAAGARRVPYILHRAAGGDLAPFYAATRPSGPSPFYEGMYLSVTCGESLALMDYDRLAEEARATRFSDYRLRRQREACAHWTGARTAKDHLEPVRGTAAVLLVSGNLDPVTPPEWAADAARTLPNARQILLPSGGHIVDGLSALDTCLDPLVVAFLDSGDPKAVDAGCIATVKPPPFTIEETATR